MSFAVVHMQKFKMSGVKGIQFHNQRERESRTNPDIDRSRTHLNYDLHNSAPIDFNRRVREIIKNNVVTDKAIRKDAVVMCNFVVTSDKGFFDRLTDWEQRKFFEKAYEFFRDRYGEQNIVAANVHLDETTPHMHLSLVPVTKEHKLSAKTLFDRKELRSLQDDFPKFMREQGFDLERGIDAEGKNKHVETQKLKVMELEKKNKALENDLKALSSKLNKLLDIEASIEKINAIEGKSGLLNKDKVTVNRDDFELLKSLAKKSYFTEQKNKKLEEEVSGLREKLNSSDQENMKYLKAIELQGSQIKKLSKAVDLLSAFLREIGQYDKATRYIQQKTHKEKLHEQER